MKRIVYDLETKRQVLTADMTAAEGVEYANGWTDYARMGVSVMCAWDGNAAALPYIFLDDNLQTAAAIFDKYEIIGSYNGVNFDRNVLAAAGVEYDSRKDYDLLRELWRADGLDPDTFERASHSGYGLDAVAVGNLGFGKLGDGANAPALYAAGRRGELITYCLNDARITSMLIDLVDETGRLFSPKTGQWVCVRTPGESISHFNHRSGR